MRTLLLRAILAIVLPAAAWPQTVVDEPKLRGILQNVESESQGELRCEVIPIKPALNFSFRFQAGFIVHVPLNQYSGKGHRWAMVIRVTPESGETVNLASVIGLPDIPQTKVTAEVGGGYLIGAGRYNVQWAMYDDMQRACRKNWTFEAKLTHAERSIRVAMPPNSVRGFSWLATAEATTRNTDDAPPVRLTVMLHAAPLSTRRTSLRVSDSLMLVGLLSSLLERLPTRSVRLVVFNLDQHKELFRQDSFSPRSLDKVAEAINSTQLGVVDYRVLQNPKGHIDMLTELVNREMHAQEQSDVVLFLGPTSRYWDNVPQSALEKTDGAGPHFFYFQYRPYYRRTATFPDVISTALRKLRGKTLLIHSPNEFAKAIRQVERQVHQASAADSSR